jgi:enoyl-CoA hydratase
VIRVEAAAPIVTVVIDRPQARNAVDRDTAEALAEAFRAFEADDALAVAVLTGAGGTFCAGADLGAIASGRANRLAPDGDGPMGPTRMHCSKPVIAAVSGFAVAGGLELACWCDLRVAERSATFGVFCRRFGVPLIDGGTVRLPRIVGLGRALDLILTGRAVSAEEAHRIGLVDRLVDDGQARAAAESLAREIAALPQTCMRSDRASVYDALALDIDAGLRREFEHGQAALRSPDLLAGASAFRDGRGRHGTQR